MTVTCPRVIAVLGCVPEAAFIVTWVLSLIFVFPLEVRPPLLEAYVNSDDYLPGAITNVQHLQCRSIAESVNQECHRFLLVSFPVKLDVLPRDSELGAQNYSLLRDPYLIVYAIY
jgi:hypothetical protein